MEQELHDAMLEMVGVSRRGGTASVRSVECDIGTLTPEKYTICLREIALRTLAGQSKTEVKKALVRRWGLRPTRGLQRQIQIVANRVQKVIK